MKKNALLASEERVFSRRGQRVRGKVLYYADSAMLTIRSSAQKYVWRWQGAEEYVLKSSFLLLYIFLGFLFFESNQHSEGVKCEDDNEG